MSNITQRELVASVRILADILWKMGRYIYQQTNDENLKAHLKELGKEIKSIRTPRNR